MTKAEIDEVLDRVRLWPLERQEEAVSMLLWMIARSADHPKALMVPYFKGQR